MSLSLLQSSLSAAEPPAGPDLWQYLLVSSAMVAAVVFLGWILRRYVASGLRGRAAGRSLQVLDALPLGGRSKLAVVRVYDRTFVLGLGEKEVNLVAELDGAEVPAPKATGSAPSRQAAGGAKGLVGAFERLRLNQPARRPSPSDVAPAPATPAKPAAGPRPAAKQTGVRLGEGRGLLG